MLSYAWPLRAVGVLFAITITTAIALGVRDRDRCPHDWQLGYVLPGSMQHTSDGYTFVLVRRLGQTPTAARLLVRYDGVLPAMVCANIDLAVEGEPSSPFGYRAEHLHPFNNGPYDRCWEHSCDRRAYRACRGARFE